MDAVPESVETAATLSPTYSDIATIAFQLWVERGSPIGSDQEDWLRAEEMLKNALVVKWEDRLGCDTLTESEIVAVFLCEGHWEVWEREWGGARWVWDIRSSRVGVSSPAYSSGKAA